MYHASSQAMQFPNGHHATCDSVESLQIDSKYTPHMDATHAAGVKYKVTQLDLSSSSLVQW